MATTKAFASIFSSGAKLNVLMCQTLRGSREATVNSVGEGMPNLFARAASLLRGGRPEAADKLGVRPLLEALGYAGADVSDPETRHRAHLLEAASQFARVFELAAPEAPGLVCFGAEFDPAIADPLHAGNPIVGVSGVGLSLQDAFQGCIGEGVEYLSQLQTASSSRRSRRIVCTPTPDFHGIAPRGSATVARFCCRRICACGGHSTGRR
jgi:hypothetical protein